MSIKDFLAIILIPFNLIAAGLFWLTEHPFREMDVFSLKSNTRVEAIKKGTFICTYHITTPDPSESRVKIIPKEVFAEYQHYKRYDEDTIKIYGDSGIYICVAFENDRKFENLRCSGYGGQFPFFGRSFPYPPKDTIAVTLEIDGLEEELKFVRDK